MKYLIMLQSPAKGARYFTRRGKGVTFDREKATAFKSLKEAEGIVKECTLWPGAKAILR